MRIIITDLTRLENLEKFCSAGVASDGTVVRPLPHLPATRCQELNVQPGSVFVGTFEFKKPDPPHVEDATYTNLMFRGPCTKAEFRSVLEKSTSPSLSDGFGVEIKDFEKCVPLDVIPQRSLITIKVDPNCFLLAQNRHRTERLRSGFVDTAGTKMKDLSVTDRGFFDYAQKQSDRPQAIFALQQFIRTQQELYLRIGLTRIYRTPDGRAGWWMQVNGIYAFPDKLDEIRVYD